MIFDYRDFFKLQTTVNFTQETNEFPANSQSRVEVITINSSMYEELLMWYIGSKLHTSINKHLYRYSCRFA